MSGTGDYYVVRNVLFAKQATKVAVVAKVVDS